MLSELTAFLYDDEAPWAVRVTEVKSEVLAAVDKVDVKVDEVKAEVAELKTDVAELKTDVAELKTDVAELKTEMKSQEERLTAQIDDVREGLTAQVDDVRASLRNHTAIQLNSLRKWPSNPIKPILAPTQVRDCWKYIMGKGFPYRLREF